MNEFFKWLASLFKTEKVETPEPPAMNRPSPRDWIKNNLHPVFMIDGYYRDSDFQVRIRRKLLKVELDKDPYATPMNIEPTKSMLPVVSKRSGVVGIWGATPSDQNKILNYIGVGDIVVYQVTNLIMHRVFAIESDIEGRTFKFLGDNNREILDSEIVRDNHIKYVIVEIIY